MTGPRLLLTAAALTLAFLASPQPTAHAQSCAMLPPGAPPSTTPAPEAARQAAHAAVSRRLTEDSITVLPAEETRRRLVDELHAECAQIDCGGAVASSLGVDFAVLVTVWAADGSPSSVSIALISSDDSSGGEAPVQDGDVETAALRALTVAFQRWQASQMGFVEVSSEPTGAEVRVDGRPIGVTPLRRLVLQGERVVSAELEGHARAEQTLEVRPTESHPITFTLEPVAAATSETSSETPTSTRQEPHWANWAIGGGLVGAGIAALVAPVHTLARLDECADRRPDDTCESTVQFGAVSGTLMAVGAIATAVGVVFLVAQPLQVDVAVGEDEASIQVRGTF